MGSLNSRPMSRPWFGAGCNFWDGATGWVCVEVMVYIDVRCWGLGLGQGKERVEV